jgi:ribosomal protein S18 acetylase RimI-like enzyme
MTTTIRLLARGDAYVLERVAPEVFDKPLNERWTAEFLADSRHHLAVALDGEVVIGMASAVHYVHPDKAPQMFVNEVAVASAYHGRGIGRQLMDCLIELASRLECTEAWVLTDRANVAAQRLYESAGGRTPPDECIMYTIPVAEALGLAF